MHIARRMVDEYRNDYGGYEDPVVRLYAEDRIGRALQAEFSEINPGDSFSLPLSAINEQLENGTQMSPTLYAKMGSYLRS